MVDGEGRDGGLWAGRFQWRTVFADEGRSIG